MKKGKFIFKATLISSQGDDFATRIARLLRLFERFFRSGDVKLYLVDNESRSVALFKRSQESKADKTITIEQLNDFRDLSSGKIIRLSGCFGKSDSQDSGAMESQVPQYGSVIKVKGDLLGLIVFLKSTRKMNKKNRIAFRCFVAIIANMIMQNRNEGPSKANIGAKVVNSVNRYVFIFDSEGKIIFANNHLRTKTGYKIGDLINRNIDDYVKNISTATCDCHFDSIINIPQNNLSLSLIDSSGQLINLTGQIAGCNLENRECFLGIFAEVESVARELERFSRFFGDSPVIGAINTLPDHRFVSINKAFLNISGYRSEELIGKSWQEMDLLVNFDTVSEKVHEILKTGLITNIEVQLKAKDGTINDVLLSGEKIYCYGKMMLLVVMIDITSQKRSLNLYYEQTKRLNSIIEGTRLGTWEWNIQTGETKFNERWAGMLGYTIDELEPVSIETWLLLVHPEDIINAQVLLQQHFNGELEFYDVEVRAKAKDGSWIWIHDRGKVIEYDKSGHPLMMYGTHSDITKKKEFEFRINELSIRDPLTNIYNRRYIYERLEQDLKRFQRHNSVFALAILDIDRFKDINDRHGHLAGDHIIKEFTGLIQENLREYDLLGRYGGEEFVIIMYDSDKLEAALIIERILEKVREQAFYYQDSKIRFTFSAGVCDSGEFDSESITNEKMISLADKRLYYAKQLGRDRIVT